jgi:hypothetical protein
MHSRAKNFNRRFNNKSGGIRKMTINDLNGAFGLILLIGGAYGGLWAIIRNALKPIKEKIELIDQKMVSRKSVQTILAMQTREIVGLKKKVMPTINVMKTFLASKGISVKPKSGEYIGDLSKLYDLSENEFIDEIRIILDKDNDEE